MSNTAGATDFTDVLLAAGIDLLTGGGVLTSDITGVTDFFAGVLLAAGIDLLLAGDDVALFVALSGVSLTAAINALLPFLNIFL